MFHAGLHLHWISKLRGFLFDLQSNCLSQFLRIILGLTGSFQPNPKEKYFFITAVCKEGWKGTLPHNSHGGKSFRSHSVSSTAARCPVSNRLEVIKTLCCLLPWHHLKNLGWNQVYCQVRMKYGSKGEIRHHISHFSRNNLCCWYIKKIQKPLSQAKIYDHKFHFVSFSS